MQRKSALARPRMETRGISSVSQALGRLEREHVALLLAICELESPAKASAAVTDSPEVRGALRALLREDLRRTQHALALAAHGLYGRCEDCHRSLSRRHLEVEPAATRCAVCAARARRAVAHEPAR